MKKHIFSISSSDGRQTHSVLKAFFLLFNLTWLSLFSVVAHASTESIKSAISPLLGNVQIEQITRTSRAGLYEVVTPKGILYTDQNGSFLIFGGTLVDTKSKVDVTAQRNEELSSFKFADLPLEDAIKTVRGDGSRIFATFEDPNCGYCRKLAVETSKLNNVTIYTFLIPILSPDSKEKSEAIWCSEDRSAAWNNLMQKNQSPAVKKGCQTPLDRNLVLAQKLRINGTPAILFANNTKIPGYIGLEQIESKLAPKNKQ